MAVKERRDTGPSGIADVKFMTKGIRVSFDGGDTFDLPLDATEKRQSGTYAVQLTADKAHAYLHPMPGKQYIFKFKQMGNRVVGKVIGQDNSGLPTNKMTAGGVGHRKDGKTFPIPRELIFIGQFEIQSEGLYKGMVATTNIPYSFQAPASGGGCDFYDSKRNLGRLEKFFSVAGDINIAMDVPFEYSPDPTIMLTTVEKAIQKSEQLFLGNLSERGFLDLDSISAVPAELLPKKSAPKKKGKK